MRHSGTMILYKGCDTEHYVMIAELRSMTSVIQ